MDRLVEVDAHEGPVYVPGEHALYFTSVRRPPARVDIKRLELESLTVTVVREDAGAANGMALAPDGRLVVCEQLHGALTLVERSSGARTLLIDGFNSPNDVVVKGDGTIWFTDPSYGWLQGFRPPPLRPDGVHRFDPGTGELVTVAESLDKPNGLCFSPDESVLYLGDSGEPRHVKAFDVLEGRRLAGERVFAKIEPGYPDGIKVDAAGRVYSSSGTGVQIFDPDGAPSGEIELPGAVNFCFGGPERDVLFITSDTAIHAVRCARGRGLARAGAIPLQAKGPTPWPSSGLAPSSTTPAHRPSSPPPRSTRTHAATASSSPSSTRTAS
jgi:gluconolactonase